MKAQSRSERCFGSRFYFISSDWHLVESTEYLLNDCVCDCCFFRPTIYKFITISTAVKLYRDATN